MARTTKGKTISYIPEEKQPFSLPNNWCWVSVDCINQYASVSIDPAKQPETIFELYSVPSSADNYPEIVSGEEIGSTKQAVEKGDVLLCKINPRINRVWEVSQHTDSALLASSEWIIIRNRLINSDYLMYCFRSPYFRDYMLSNVSGVGGSLMRAQPKYVKEYPVPIPPLAEQQRIVDRIESLFAKLDEAKEKAQTVVDGFEDRKAAILHKAFTGELTAEWRDRHGLLHNEWRKKRLDEFAEIVSGFAFSSSDFKETNCVPCIKITNVGVGEFNGNDYEYLPAEYLSKYERFNVKRNDILISLTRSYIASGLKVCIYPDDGMALLNQRVALIRNCNIKYAFYYLTSESVLNYVKEKSKTTNQPNLSIKDLCSLTIPVPTKHEQLEIAVLLDSLLDREKQAKEAAEQVIDQIDAMKKAILARAFRGELGTNDPNDEPAVELLKRVLE